MDQPSGDSRLNPARDPPGRCRRYGGVSRNAVIGQIHRLGISDRVVPTKSVHRPIAAGQAGSPSAPSAGPSDSGQ
jgi:hypothetical protein